MPTINDQIRAAMAKAFFASAWADMQDEKDSDDASKVNLSGKEIMSVMPDEVDPGAIHAARTLEFDLARANPFWRAHQGKADPAEFLSKLFERAQSCERTKYADRELTPENFGHYLAMQAMGHGVGLADAFGDAVYSAITVPYVEFGSHSLQKDY
jgi:hypothetical protein